LIWILYFIGYTVNYRLDHWRITKRHETRRARGNGKNPPDQTPLHGPDVLDHGAADIHDATGSGGQYTREELKHAKMDRTKMPGYIKENNQRRNGGQRGRREQ
jgi:hypothetical protein